MQSSDPTPSPEELLSATVSDWIDGLRSGDQRSAEELWQRYFQRLVHFAEGRMPRALRKVYDGEDVALSAFHSMCEGVRDGRFPDLRSRDELWSLLIVIAARKSYRGQRAANALKRGGGAVGELEAVVEIAGVEPTPEFAAAIVDEVEHRIAILADDKLREIARGKLEGLSNEALAERLDCTVRTVERRLALIRRIWSEHEDE